MMPQNVVECDDVLSLELRLLERPEGEGPSFWTALNCPPAGKSPSAFGQQIEAIATECCEAHPLISLEKGIFGGIPHLREVRLSVGDVLAQIYLRGSLQAVVDYYSSEISVEQVREAVAYAQDFIEDAFSAT